MANAFTLFGEISVDTSRLDSGLTRVERNLERTARSLNQTERAAGRLSGGSAVVARSFERLNDTVRENDRRLRAAAEAYSRGQISARQYASVLSSVERATTRVSNAVRDQNARLKDTPIIGAEAIATLKRLGFAAGVAATALSTYAVKQAMDLESLRLGLKAVIPASEDLNATLARLKEISKLPGLGFGEAVQGAINLRAAGLSAQTAEGALRAFGNALATVGKGRDELFGVITALTQIAAKGKITAQEINQLAERLPQVRVAMQAAFGTANTELLQKMGISAEDFINKLIVEFDKLPKVATSAKGALENLIDEIDLALAPLGDRMINAVRPELEAFTKALESHDYTEAARLAGFTVGKSIKNGVIEGIKTLGDPESRGFVHGAILGIAEGLFPESMQPYVRARGQMMGNVFLDSGLIPSVNSMGEKFAEKARVEMAEAVASASPDAQKYGLNLGNALVDGFLGGLAFAGGRVYDATKGMAKTAEQGAKDGLESKSPSKVFFRIGKDTVQGFIDGINVMKAGANAAAAGIIDPSILGPLLKGKGGEQMLGFLRGLVDEFNRLNAPTKADEFEQLVAKIGNLSPEAQKAADSIRKFIAELEKRKAVEETKEKIKALKDEFLSLGAVPLTHVERLQQALADPAVAAGIDETTRAIMRLNAQAADLQKILGGGASGRDLFAGLEALSTNLPSPETRTVGAIDTSMLPPPPREVLTAWQEAFAQLREDYADTGKAIADINANALAGIGDVFASAVANWDGTAAGFFRSIAQGFRQMAQQIIAELIRIAIMKLVLKIGSAIGGSAAGGVDTSGFRPDMAGYATGGYIQGPGTGTSDSIPAMLSNGEFVIPARSVQKFGVDFFEALRKGQMPMRRYANGGMVMPSASSVANTSNSTSNYNNVFNISVPAGAGQQPTATMVQKSVLDALRKHEKRNK